MKNNIVLTASQIYMVALAGVMRHIQFLCRNAKPQYGQAESSRWDQQIEGALSEYALAKFLNKHWEGVGVAGGDDLKEEEVRVTKYKNGWLPLHPTDKDHKRYWLLTGENGDYMVRGYIYAKDGKQEKYWVKKEEKGRDRSCYEVPQLALFSPDIDD